MVQQQWTLTSGAKPNKRYEHQLLWVPIMASLIYCSALSKWSNIVTVTRSVHYSKRTGCDQPGQSVGCYAANAQSNLVIAMRRSLSRDVEHRLNRIGFTVGFNSDERKKQPDGH